MRLRGLLWAGSCFSDRPICLLLGTLYRKRGFIANGSQVAERHHCVASGGAGCAVAAREVSFGMAAAMVPAAGPGDRAKNCTSVPQFPFFNNCFACF